MGQPRRDAGGAPTDGDVIAAYRAGLTIREVADVFGLAPGRVAQLIAATGAARRRRARALHAVATMSRTP